MIEQLIKDIKSIGFRVVPDERDGVNGFLKWIELDTIPSKALTIKLLNLLNNDCELFFWNKYHKTISDPGSYVSAIVSKGGVVSYKEGNHGWSSEWKTMSIEEMADFIILNWAEDADRGEFKNRIRLDENKWNK